MRPCGLPAALLVLLLLLPACSRPPAQVAATIRLDGETYTLPGEGDLVWTHTPKEVIWAERGRRPVIRATLRRTGGGPLTQGVRDVAPVIPILEEGDPRSSRLVHMQAAGDWLIYTMELIDPAQPARRTVHLFLVSLKQPAGSQAIGSASVTARDRFLAALGGGYVVWQRHGPVGPGDRYTRGETHVFRRRDRREWRLPSAGWARELRIEGDTLMLALRDGGTERISLLRPEAPGEEAIIARADFDGDGREDLLMGKADRGGTYEPVWVKAADGRLLLGPLGAGQGRPAVARVTDAWVHPLGGQLPILILADIGGSGGQGLLAFRHDPQRQALVPLAWGEQESEWGFPGLDPATGRFIVAHRTYDYVQHMLNVAYTYRDRRLAEEARWYDPRPEEISPPSDPTFVLLAALMTLTLELPEETPRYFADEAMARRFYREWSAQAPKGAYWRLVDDKGLPQSVQDGATVSFAAQASMPGGRGPVTVRGRIAFVQQGHRYRIQEITAE